MSSEVLIVRKPERRPVCVKPTGRIRLTQKWADIQKILRHARKLPEKTANFYKGLQLATAAFRTSPILSLYAEANELPLEKRRLAANEELNRLRRAALSLGFHELLEGMATILERECTLLPGSAHPDAALQLTHASSFLRGPSCRDYAASLLPLRTKFSAAD